MTPPPARLSQDSDYVVAVRNFLPEDPSLLAFHKGDIIHLQPLEPPRMGQLPCRGGGGRLGEGASLAGADRSLGHRLQCRLCRPQEGRVPGGAAPERPRLRWVPRSPASRLQCSKTWKPQTAHPGFMHSQCRCMMGVSQCPKGVCPGRVC